jgi:histidinol-phosphate aminotransferase
MTLSRREFVRRLGVSGAAGVLSTEWVSARGHEARGDAWAAARDGERPFQIQLDSNENPHGPGPRALEAIRNAFPVVHRYPYAETETLTAAIAAFHGVDADNVVLGCGSAEILRMAMQAYTSRSKPLVTPVPTYESPTEYAAAFDVPVRSVNVNRDLKIDLAGMEARAKGAGLIFVCNPNNPTATTLGAATMEQFVSHIANRFSTTAVLIDEAYHEYVDDPGYKTSVPLAVKHRNVIVSRTFSKMYGMAGLRCGYGIGHSETMTKLYRYKLETSVNQAAIAAVLESLGDVARVESERRINREVRNRTRALFESMGYDSGASDTNFIFVDLERDASEFRDACRESGVVIGRAFPPFDNYARISIGTMDEMNRAGAVFKTILSASRG